MYLSPLKSALVEATRDHFNAAYINSDFVNTWISIEYPREKANYPGIWLNYQDSGELERAGIDHHEFVTDSNGTHVVTRWRFSGSVSLTACALTSYERDRLYDEVVRMIAFAGVEGTNSSIFRSRIESNDFIAMNGNFDVLNPSGEAASPGTPWSSDDIIYEKTLSFDLIGEVVSDPTTNDLVNLSAIDVMSYVDGTTAPVFPDNPIQNGGAPLWSPQVFR